MAKATAKEKIQAWLNNPRTPDDAWVHLTYKEIAESAGVSYTSVTRYLVMSDARSRGYDIKDVRRRRKTAWHERVGRMTPKKLDKLKAYRAQNPPLSYEECAVRLDQSVWSVKYNCEKHHL